SPSPSDLAQLELRQFIGALQSCRPCTSDETMFPRSRIYVAIACWLLPSLIGVAQNLSATHSEPSVSDNAAIDHLNEGSRLMEQGSITAIKQAIKEFNIALQLSKEHPERDVRIRAASLRGLGSAKTIAGSFLDAAQTHAEAKKIYQQLHDNL